MTLPRVRGLTPGGIAPTLERDVKVKLRDVPYERIDGGDNLFQSPFWGRFKSLFGWTPQGFHFSSPVGSGSLLVLTRPIAAARRIAYVPLGPDLVLPPSEHGGFLEALSSSLQRQLPPGCVFLRYDLAWRTPYAEEDGARPASGEDPRPAPRIRELRMNFGTSKWNLRKAPTDLLPPDTVVVDLSVGEQRLLSEMSSTARYNVRMSKRRGVTAEVVGPEHLQTWQRMYTDTARRHGLEGRHRSYFRRLFAAAPRSPGEQTRLRLLFARVGGSVAAGMILALCGRRAVYLFGASTRRHSSLAPSHRLQWRAMQLARQHGCTSYDLFGIPPSNNPAHPLHGLLRFKTGFGGEILRRRGCWDFPFDLPVYEQLRGVELVREPFHRAG
jgi:lipid II:glycine glycyltransferase (peptidoglycan interpeptide bridge formation enzyme)